MYLVLRIEIYAGSAFARCITTGVKVAVALETADLGVCKIRKVSYRKTAALSLSPSPPFSNFCLRFCIIHEPATYKPRIAWIALRFLHPSLDFERRNEGRGG